MCTVDALKGSLNKGANMSATQAWACVVRAHFAIVGSVECGSALVGHHRLGV